MEDHQLYIAMLQDAEGGSGGGGTISKALARVAEPWAHVYSHSKSLSAAVLFLHLVPLLVAGGAAVVADRATLRAVRAGAAERARHLTELAGTHRVVVGGLALSLVSGVLLFFSDVETFLPSPFFWIKLSCVALLLANGFAMTRTEARLARDAEDAGAWSLMRTIAIASLVLWTITTLAGVVLKEFA